MNQLSSKATIAFDEAGNTGQQLLDPHQPVFVHASTNLDEPSSIHLLDALRSCRVEECHFVRLKKSGKGRKAIMDFLAGANANHSGFKVALYHKEFMVIAKIVDLLVEPLAQRDGLNLYEGAANLALSNILFIGLHVFVDAVP